MLEPGEAPETSQPRASGTSLSPDCLDLGRPFDPIGLGSSVNGGTPTWMVCFMENLRMDDLGVSLFWKALHENGSSLLIATVEMIDCIEV